jgi:hypothetical protein
MYICLSRKYNNQTQMQLNKQNFHVKGTCKIILKTAKVYNKCI